MTILAQVSGLTDVDSIHGFLKVADECLKEMRQSDWDEIHRRVPKDKLIEAMWLHLGHPLRYPEIEVEHILDFALWLGENGETVLAELLKKLVERQLKPYDSSEQSLA